MPPNEEEEDQNIYGGEEEEDEELLDGEESDEEEEDEDEDEEEEDLNCDSPSTSSDDPINKQSSVLATAIPLNTTSAVVTIAATGTLPNQTPTPAPSAPAPAPAPQVSHFSPDHKRQRISEPSSSSIAIEEKKPSALDDSRRLFQRLWTDEDEIGLLQGFLDFTTQRGPKNSSHHHDTGPFYDQIKTRLQLDFNKNQLVEKLRRLKKKYRNVMSRISSGKDFSFKSPHDQATFEISRKIWSEIGAGVGEAGIEDDEGNPLNTEINNNGIDVNSNSEKKVPKSRKRSPKRALEENLSNPSNLLNCPVKSSMPNVIEETVRSCLSPLFKELLYSAINGPCNVRGLGSMALNPLPLNFGGNPAMNFLSGEVVDEKWRKQHILELEVYGKRMELVQDQIKLALEELRSMGSS